MEETVHTAQTHGVFMAAAPVNRFDALREEAEQWCGENSAGWKLFIAEETDRQLIFTQDHDENGKLSFSVICPISHSSLKATSDNEDVLSIVRSIHSHDSNNIQEYLEKITAALEPLVETHCSREDEADDDMDCDDYYNSEMDEAEPPPVRNAVTENYDDDLQRYSGSGSHLSARRLVVDLKTFQQSDGKFGIRGSPRDDNLFLWDVQLTDFDSGSLLTRDLNRYAAKYKERPEVQLEVIFPEDYPMSPPFIRVIKPRFKVLAGHVTIGGSFCIELLTKSGWRPINDIESTLVQVRSAIMSHPDAGLHPSEANVAYTMTEAKTAFQRMVQQYKWF